MVERIMAADLPVPREVDVGGQVVGVYEFGDPAGAPVMVFHGTPACGAGFAWADDPARARGLRLIAPDRPGVGLSSRVASWTIADYPANVEALANTLGIDQFSVWGYSGGGPYAVACAALLTDRVTMTAVAAGMGQVGVWATIDESEKTDRQMLELSITHPALARLLLGISGRGARVSPKIAMKSFEKQLNESDRGVVMTLGPPRQVMALFTQAFLRGAYGVVADYAAIARPWGFDVESITTPMAIFHGDADTMVPLRHSEELARRVRGSELIVWPGAGHLGTITHIDDILDAFR
ncbi:MAG: alpha/beta fold hydrolase [Acidimicrobiia bacterium]